MKFIGNSLLQFVKDFTVIDLETTGRSNLYKDITELSGIKYRNGKPVAFKTTLVKSENTILPFVESLTGISNSMIENAPKIEDVIESFVDFIGDDIILGHNVEFDYGLIFNAYHSLTGIEMRNDCIDTLRISRLMNKDIENHKLSTLCTYFGVARHVGHRGMDDSKQTAQVYLKMHEKYNLMRNKKQEEQRFYERLRLG